MYNIMKKVNNYFFDFKERGEYSILDNTIEVRGNYIIGQYVLIKGSILNDGVYQIRDIKDNIITLDGLLNTEVFDGYICALKVPTDFIMLCKEIEEFNKENVKTQIVSESFPGNYSYTKATNKDNAPITWENVFKSELINYKKIYDGFRRVKEI